MKERQMQGQARNKLQPRHVEEFSSSDCLFDRFARVVCQVGVILRKELFETWAMALYVHRTFPKTRRIADLACSHGLLSWALLLLARYDAETGHDAPNKDVVERSLVCIDLHMPKSAEKIAKVMLEEWPELKEYWDYVEGPLEALEPHPSTLLVGIHACGLLSDKVLSQVIHGNCPLALVPCCHSRKSLTLDQKGQFQQQQQSSPYTLADIIDAYRIQRLQDAGFEVHEASIPKVFTPKNRIILVSPNTSLGIRQATGVAPPPLSMTSKNGNNKQRPDDDGWALPKFRIPVADTPEDRSKVRSLAGREASMQRKQGPPRSLHISLLLPVDRLQLAAIDLQAVVPIAGTTVETVCPEPFWHPEHQRYARTFKVIYPQGAGKQDCKRYHQELRERVPDLFPGAEVRY